MSSLFSFTCQAIELPEFIAKFELFLNGFLLLRVANLFSNLKFPLNKLSAFQYFYERFQSLEIIKQILEKKNAKIFCTKILGSRVVNNFSD